MTTYNASDIFFLGAKNVEINKKQALILILVPDIIAWSDVYWLIIIICGDVNSEMLGQKTVNSVWERAGKIPVRWSFYTGSQKVERNIFQWKNHNSKRLALFEDAYLLDS